VPHPVFFDRPRSFSQTLDNAERDEHAAHLQFGWMVPLGDRFDLFLSGGPSFFRVSQDVVSDLSFAEQGPPFSSVNVNAVTTTSKRNATGFNLNVDATYVVYQRDRFRLGVGGLLRFTGATADLNVGGTTIATDLGGVQVAAGLRLRF
jgi:hypothetical protein